MPNPLTLTDAADLIDVSIQDIWLKGSEKESQLFKQYFNVETGVSDYYMKDSSLTGLGYAGRVVENAAVTAASPVQGFDKVYTQVQFGILMSFTKMMWFFGIKKRNLERITEEARKACSDLRELRCAERLDNAFGSSYTATDISGNYLTTVTGGDGLPFISATHTREDGGTAWSNRVTDGTTVNMAFEYNALKAAFRTAALVPNPLGKPTNINLDTLVVARGYSVANRAKEILGAINKGWIPGSADRDGSATPAYKIIELPWIQTNTSYWFMMDSSMKNSTYGLQYKESQGIELEGPNVVFKTGEIQYKATLIKSNVNVKSFLINGETPEEDNAQQASESCAVATTEWKEFLRGISNSLNIAYNFIKNAMREIRSGFPTTIMFDCSSSFCYA